MEHTQVATGGSFTILDSKLFRGISALKDQIYNGLDDEAREDLYVKYLQEQSSGKAEVGLIHDYEKYDILSEYAKIKIQKSKDDPGAEKLKKAEELIEIWAKADRNHANIAAALVKIESERLYESSLYTNMAEYLRFKWDMSESRFYQYKRFYEIRSFIENSFKEYPDDRFESILLPERESHARPIFRRQYFEIRKIWEIVMQQCNTHERKLTGSLVDEIATKLYPKGTILLSEPKETVKTEAKLKKELTADMFDCYSFSEKALFESVESFMVRLISEKKISIINHVCAIMKNMSKDDVKNILSESGHKISL